jgi:hypothetical protein
MPCAEYYHSTNFACLVFNGIRYAAYRQRELARDVSHPFAAFHSISSWFFFIFIFGTIYFKRNIFNGEICVYQLFNSEQSDRESGGTLPDSVRPSRTHPHPMRALSHRLLTYVSPSPALVAFPPRCRSVGKRQLQSEQAAFFFLRSIDFAAVGRYTFEFIVLTIWVGWCRVGDDEDDAGGCRLGGAEGGGECL